MTGVLPQRPLPHPTELSAPFWDACRQRRLTVQQCDSCTTHVFVPRPFCPVCLGQSFTWVDSSGRGVVVTFTVVCRAQTPAFETPYVVAVVRLEEGYEMLTNVVDTAPEQLRIGDRVHVHFVDVSDSVTLPCFRVSAQPS